MDSVTSQTKVCTKCRVGKTLDAFYKYRSKRDGLASNCKECMAEAERVYHALNKEKLLPVPETTLKRCSKCGEEKLLSDFGKNKGKADGRTVYCRRCLREYNKASRAANPELAKESRARNKLKMAVYGKEYRKTNAESITVRINVWNKNNPDKLRNRYVRYRAANYTTVRAREKAAAARRRDAVGHHTGADILEKYAQQGGLCYWCQIPVPDSYHVDHVIPISRGGSNWPSNIVITCASCNLRKNAKMPDEWLAILKGEFVKTEDD